MNEEFEQIAEIFQRHGADFMVIGGQAELLHGSSRVTYDVDFCYRRTPENLVRVVAALKELQPTLRGAPKDLPFILDERTLAMGTNFTFDTELMPLDLLGYVEPFGGFETLEARGVVFRSGELRLLTISLDDLLAIKKHVNRAKDQESIIQLTALVARREQGKTARRD